MSAVKTITIVATAVVLLASVVGSVYYINHQKAEAQRAEKEAEQAEKDERNAQRQERLDNQAQAQPIDPDLQDPALDTSELTPTEQCQLKKALDDLGQQGYVDLIEEYGMYNMTILEEYVKASLSMDPQAIDPQTTDVEGFAQQIGESATLTDFLSTKGYVC